MLFNSLQFAIFFVIVYALYLILSHRWQNRMLLVASCIFYGAWDWRFLFLIFASISIDYFCALFIQDSTEEKIRKRFVTLSIVVNLLVLGFFKYCNFFIDSFQALFSHFGLPAHMRLLNIILPIGISFYTFEAMSYVIDVYRRKMEPVKDYLDYALFVTYFPHLIAGPIMRAKDLLPQISSPRKLSLDKFYEGSFLFFWGLFEKVFIADNLAKIADPIFKSSLPSNGAEILVAVYAFAFQIFCDFDGYSNIARGLGKCMGFDIIINFNLPYFSTNPMEFWRRWHISLSTWLRDYLYIPLGGSKEGIGKTYRNLALTMLLGGLWHGAKWTFVIWGGYHGSLLIIHRLFKPLLEKIPSPKSPHINNVWFAIKVIFFFNLVCFGWLIFRADSMTQVAAMLYGLIFNFGSLAHTGFKMVIFFVLILLLVQLAQFQKDDLMVVYRSNFAIRTAFYYVCAMLLIMFGVPNAKQFIYFQF